MGDAIELPKRLAVRRVRCCREKTGTRFSCVSHFKDRFELGEVER